MVGQVGPADSRSEMLAVRDQISPFATVGRDGSGNRAAGITFNPPDKALIVSRARSGYGDCYGPAGLAMTGRNRY
jgi:hypothetical protein